MAESEEERLWNLAEKRAAQIAPKSKRDVGQTGIIGAVVAAAASALGFLLSGQSINANDTAIVLTAGAGLLLPVLYLKNLDRLNTKAFVRELAKLKAEIEKKKSID
jgi:hypothetical protein